MGHDSEQPSPSGVDIRHPDKIRGAVADRVGATMERRVEGGVQKHPGRRRSGWWRRTEARSGGEWRSALGFQCWEAACGVIFGGANDRETQGWGRHEGRTHREAGADARVGPTHERRLVRFTHRPAILFSQSKPTTNNQPTVLFSQNKPAPAISHQPNE
jgi:hypothetical protein